MTRWLAMLRYDVVLQARQGFYAASALLVVVISALLLSIPETARQDHALWVPALFVVNLPITTLFFIAGLILLEREEGTLSALGVSPISAGHYLALRMVTLISLAVVETIAVALLAFGTGAWPMVAIGAAAMGIVYTGCGAGISARYTSVNELILPVSVFVAFLLLPLLPHFGLLPRWPFYLHPIEPALTLLRGAFTPLPTFDALFAVAGSAGWCVLAWCWGRDSVQRAMRDTAATGGR
jgi:fluoroquinolone transport system permease protein